MALTTNDIVRLLSDHGAKQYGREAVSQLEHALQCAHLAESAGEPDEVIIASLLHDVGHMLKAESGSAMEFNTDRDDLHQYTLMPVLMTALVAAFALTPLLFSADAPGKEILHPVAVVIFGGIISSTLLDSLLTPVLYWRLGEEATKRLIAESDSNGVV